MGFKQPLLKHLHLWFYALKYIINIALYIILIKLFSVILVVFVNIFYAIFIDFHGDNKNQNGQIHLRIALKFCQILITFRIGIILINFSCWNWVYRFYKKITR